MADATITLTLHGIDDLRDWLAEAMDTLDSRLARIERRQALLEQAINRNTINDINFQEALMADLTPIADEVTAIAGTVDSTVVLLDRLADMITDAAGDPDEVLAVAAQVREQRVRLAAAVDAVPDETPTEPEPTPEPEPVEEPTEPEPAPEG